MKALDFEGFGKAILKEYWEHYCGDIDGIDVQELAEKYGLIVEEPYDPAKHGEGGLEQGMDVGDPWFVPAWPKEEK